MYVDLQTPMKQLGILMQQIPLKLSLNSKITIVTKTCPSFYKKHTLTNFTNSSFNSFLRVVQWDFTLITI